MTWYRVIGLVLLGALWITAITFFVDPRRRIHNIRLRWAESHSTRYRVDRCGPCRGSGRQNAHRCPSCRGRGKVVRHPGSPSTAGPAPLGAEVGSFVGGPVW